MQGIGEVLGKLKAVTETTKYKGGRTALRKAAALIQAKVKEAAIAIDDPNSPEKIYINVDVRFSPKRFKATGDLGFRVGIAGGARQYANTAENVRKRRVGKEYATGGETWYWRLIEFGTEKMAARPFMRPALEQNIDQATDLFMREYNKVLDRAIKKGGNNVP